jgi:TetR/AcrR family acrAB operon transcriptional repressor
MARKTWAEAQLTRQRILDAAGAIFLAHGFAGSSLQRIAQAAGLTRGAIYWHFTNKQQLLQALMARASCGEPPQDSKIEDGDPTQALVRLAMAPLERLSRSTPLQRALGMPFLSSPADDAGDVVGNRTYEEDKALLLQALRSAYEQLHRQRQLAGGPPPMGDPSLGLTWLIEGLMRRWVRDPEAFDLLGIGGLAISSYIHGIFGSAASPPSSG